MIKFMHRCKGVITVFLIIILIPVMTLSAIMVDGSRMLSAKMIAQEAADLASLSVITDYNTVLKEQFGLFALENPDNVQEIFNRYFMESLVASGFGASDSYADMIYSIVKKNIFGENTFSDSSFINLYDFTLDSSSVTPMYSLANHEVLGYQIVEYSKYRGISEIAERLEILNHFDEVKKQVQDSKDDVELMDKKMNIDEKMGDIESAIYKIYDPPGKGKSDAYIYDFNGAYKDLKEELDGSYSRSVREIVDDLALADGNNPDETLYDYSAEKIEYFIDEMKERLEDIDETCTVTVQKIDALIGELRGFKAVLSENSSEAAKELSKDVDDDIKNLNLYKKQLVETKGDVAQNNWQKREYLNKLKQLVPSKIKNTAKTCLMNTPNREPYLFYHFSDVVGADGKVKTTEDKDEAYSWYKGRWEDYFSKISQIAGENPIAKKKDAKFDSETAKQKAKDVNDKTNDESENSVTLTRAEREQLPSRSFNPKEEVESYGDISSDDDPDFSVAENEYHFDEDNGKSDLKNIISTSTKVLGAFAESARDDILIYSYILGTFKTRLSPIKFDVPDNLDAGYVTKWRYKDGKFANETDLRGDEKIGRKTRFYTSEVEYIFGGNRSEDVNNNLVYSWIFGTRLANNLVAVYLDKGPDGANDQCLAAAAIASAATFGAVPVNVFHWIFMSAWAAAETLVEMDYLIKKGYRIPLIKTKDNLLIGSISDTIDTANRLEKITESGMNVCYEDYLVLLMAFVPKKVRMMRIADLIELNMATMEQSGFKMDNAYTYVRSEAALSTRFIFMPVKQFNEGYKNLPGRLKFTTLVYQGY